MNAFEPKITRSDFIAVIAAMIIGLTLSTLPHLLWFFKTGDPAWIADNDDLLYLSFASVAYHNHPMHLADPVLLHGGLAIYPTLQLIPAVLLAKIMGLAPIYINLIWRIGAGFTVPLAWYLVTRSFLKSAWIALAVTIVMMTDVGLLTSWVASKHFVTVGEILTNHSGNLFLAHPTLLPQWRIITPALSLPYLLLHIWLLYRATLNSNPLRTLLAAASFGSLYYVYFYFWTAAGLALMMGALLDSRNRKTSLWVVVIGMILSLPGFAHKALGMKAYTDPAWMHRIDLFLPIPHLSELLFPKLAFLFSFVSLFWVWFRRRELIPLWLVGVAALVLENHQLLTGLQIQNFHWTYCWGPVVSLLVILMIIDPASSHPYWKKVLFVSGGALCLFYLVTGFWLRSLEATKTREPVELTTSYHEYIRQRFSEPRTPLEPRGVVAGSKEFINFSVILENQRPLNSYAVDVSPAVNDAEWGMRAAVNSYLKGESRESFAMSQEKELFDRNFGPWSRDRKKLSEAVEARKRYFDEVVTDPPTYLNRLQVRYVALPTKGEMPKYLSIGWKPLQSGPSWNIWEFEQTSND